MPIENKWCECMGVWVYGCMGVWVYGCMGVCVLPIHSLGLYKLQTINYTR
jgi:hypothetical protein